MSQFPNLSQPSTNKQSARRSSQKTTWLKTISRIQLESYLSKAICTVGLQDLRIPHDLYDSDGIQMYPTFDRPTKTLKLKNYSQWQFYTDILSGAMYERYEAMLDFIKDVKPKIINNCINMWGTWEWPTFINRSRATVADIKAIDPDIVVQGSPNEYVDNTTLTEFGISPLIPDDVYTAFGLPVPDAAHKRFFDLNLMKFDDVYPGSTNTNHFWDNNNSGTYEPHSDSYSGDGIVPDISKLESQMWFYFLGCTYINMGCESLSFCQVGLMNNDSKDPAHWNEVFSRLRTYADSKDNIRFLLITGHTQGMADADGNLAFDYHSAPCRPSEYLGPTSINGGPTILTPGQCPPIELYGESIGGITPSGWYCVHAPGQIFVDNYGNFGPPDNWGTPGGPGCSQYNWDEITWFAMQSASYRNEWIQYAYYKVRCIDQNLYFSLPAMRSISIATPARLSGWWFTNYYAINPSDIFPAVNTFTFDGVRYPDRSAMQLYPGFGQQNVIKSIFANADNSPMRWVHHDFTEEDVYSRPATPHVRSDLIFVGDDKMFYISTDNLIHGYIKDNGAPGTWRTVSPSWWAHGHGAPIDTVQVRAKSSLVADPAGTMLLYIGTDNYVHGFRINDVWNYTYFDFMKESMAEQHILAKSNLLFASNSRIYYIAQQSDGSNHVHGFINTGSGWDTVSPTYACGLSDHLQAQAGSSLIYDSLYNTLYYVGKSDSYIYGYYIYNDWTYGYNNYPLAHALLSAQGLRMKSNLAIHDNRMYYVAEESTGHFRIHCLIRDDAEWSTVSPSWSADMYNAQPIGGQETASASSFITVGPDGTTIAYIGADQRIYYYHTIPYEDWNYSYNYPHFPPPGGYAINSLQLVANEIMFYIGNNHDVHQYTYQSSDCDNPAIYANELFFSYE